MSDGIRSHVESSDNGGGRGVSGDNATNTDDTRPNLFGGGNFTEAEECLWLRVFGAVERYARPSRTDPKQGPTPFDLVPLEKAVSIIEDIFGRSSSSESAQANSSSETALGSKKEVTGR